MIWFFRDPHRIIPTVENVLLSPADGKIIFIEEKLNVIKIAIRMSPFNVHINRSPINGMITSITKTPGKHVSVYFKDVEKMNERNLLVIENDDLSIELLQLTGAFARRIECWVNINQRINQGDKIGIIRFGSQVNLIIHLKNAEKKLNTMINLGESVKAGEDILITMEG